MDPLVSILIPAYNSEKWLADAINSALAQTWPRKEIIVVDDGSTDNTRSVARQFSSKTVTVVTQPNQGASAARNRALSLSQGDYIQWLDSDDLLAPDKVKNQLKRIDCCQDKLILLSGAWGRFFYRFHKARFTRSSLWQDLEPVEWLIRKMAENVWMQTSCWLVSRELSEIAGPWDIRLLGDDDGEYFCRVIRASTGIKFVAEARSYYRTSNFDSLSHKLHLSERKLEAAFLSISLHVEHLRSIEDSRRTRNACLRLLQDNLLLFYPERKDIIERFKSLAMHLEGQLQIPMLSWKYAWIRRILGWKRAKQVRFTLPNAKAACLSNWDRFLFAIERRLASQLKTIRKQSTGRH
jgi:glycosyltransferase involved in cell wall biosynthesis